MSPAAALRVRSAALGDAPALAQLSGQLGYPVSGPELADRLRAILDRHDHCVRVAERDGAIAGWIHGMAQIALEAGSWCEILGLVVDGRHRGAGAGRALVEEIERWARARSLHTIKVRSNVVREESHPFYVRLGFVRIKSQHVYRKALD
ncbi:MAG TPA: GNAT family N-acetyltransferase [Gemmatimonadales bacterium]|nr:GNAT family N-acetyltransferase [Gemmatimonadales bacterium]